MILQWLHSVVLKVGTRREVLQYAESTRMNAGIGSYHILLVSVAFVATRVEGRDARSRSKFAFKDEFENTRPSATDPGHPTIRSTNRFR